MSDRSSDLLTHYLIIVFALLVLFCVIIIILQRYILYTGPPPVTDDRSAVRGDTDLLSATADFSSQPEDARAQPDGPFAVRAKDATDPVNNLYDDEV
jgi:hypothetical protein